MQIRNSQLGDARFGIGDKNWRLALDWGMGLAIKEIGIGIGWIIVWDSDGISDGIWSIGREKLAL